MTTHKIGPIDMNQETFWEDYNLLEERINRLLVGYYDIRIGLSTTEEDTYWEVKITPIEGTYLDLN